MGIADPSSTSCILKPLFLSLGRPPISWPKARGTRRRGSDSWAEPIFEGNSWSQLQLHLVPEFGHVLKSMVHSGGLTQFHVNTRGLSRISPQLLPPPMHPVEPLASFLRRGLPLESKPRRVSFPKPGGSPKLHFAKIMVLVGKCLLHFCLLWFSG